jgi:hypothetical protein
MKMTRLHRVVLLGVDPPPSGSERVDRLAFVRSLLARSAGLNAVLWIVCASLMTPLWVLAALTVGIVLAVLDVAYLSMQLRRLRQG